MTENRPCSDSLPAPTMHNGFHNTAVLIMAQLVGFNYVRKRKGPKMGAKYSHFKGGDNSEGVGLDREKRVTEMREGLPTSSLRSHLHPPDRAPSNRSELERESWKISLLFLGHGFQMAGLNWGSTRRDRKPESNEDQRGSDQLRKPLSGGS